MRLGHYEVLSPLGAGGMGEVFRARDSALGREVAIKVLPIYLRENAEALARFEREAKAVAALSHPNILAIHEFGSPDGRWVLALTPDARPRILLHPTGPGQTREIPNPESVDFLGMKWLPDGRIVAFGASKSRMRGSVIDPADGSHRTFTEEGVEPVRYWSSRSLRTAPASWLGTRKGESTRIPWTAGRRPRSTGCRRWTSPSNGHPTAARFSSPGRARFPGGSAAAS
jgi:hypothetical protein